MANGEPLPRLAAQTLESRAARSGQIWEMQRRVQQQTENQFETVGDPDRIPVERQGNGFAPTDDFLGMARPREAAHDLDPQFPAQDLAAEDVRRVEGGFRPREPIRRRKAARELEEQTPLDEVAPQDDLVPRGGGFGLAGPAQRELGAAKLDPQFEEVDVSPDDVERTGDEQFGLTPFAERRVAAERIEDQVPLDDVGPGEVRETDSGFELRESVIEQNRGLFF